MHRLLARRVPDGWSLDVEGLDEPIAVGTLKDAPGRARSALALVTGEEETAISTQLRVELGGGYDSAVRDAVQATVDAQRAQTAAAAQVRDVVRRLSSAGISGRDIGHILSVSPQRVSQLLAAGG